MSTRRWNNEWLGDHIYGSGRRATIDGSAVAKLRMKTRARVRVNASGRNCVGYRHGNGAFERYSVFNEVNEIMA